MLIWGGEIFNLDFDMKTPFYADQTYVDTHPGYSLFDPTPKCTLYTMVFQTFVFMQLFNQFNARILGEREINIFKGIFRNWMFIAIAVFTFVVQWMIVWVGGRAVRCVPLSNDQNLYCAGLGCGSLIWGLVIKFILPASLFKCLVSQDKPMTDEEEAKSIVAQARLSQRQMSLRRQ